MKNLQKLLLAFLLLGSISVFAIDITVQLRDSDNTIVADAGTAVLKYYDGGWHTTSNDGTGTFDVATTSSSLTYKMYYHNGTQQMVVPTTTTTIVFNTVTTTPTLKTSGTPGTALSGGTVKHYQNGWSSTFAANTAVELLPGNHTFKMYYNNGTQQINNEPIFRRIR